MFLGYNEKDTERGNDSFNTFEEVLQLAVLHEVDFILLGGDLFHDANPSTSALNRCLKLLRIYCMGDKPIEIEFLSDQSQNFMDSLSKRVNYEDPNLNISIPVFSIHGNHDDPSGFGGLSSLDLLSTSGLINYFGNWENATKICIEPIMLKKNETKLAIYGLSYIHDNRLSRLFDDGHVKISQPPDESSWFNIFVVHQNRANRGLKNFLPEDALPAFANLIIWGHEHDCRIEPEKNLKRDFFVVQPGSTVATSLAEGEAIPKHCAILYVDKGDFKIEKIALKTVRPFIFDNFRVLDNIDENYLNEGRVEEKVTDYVKKRVTEMLQEAKEQMSGHEKQPLLPLIRLRIEVNEECQMFNIIRFGQAYIGVVANPLDMVLFARRFGKKTKLDVELDTDLLSKAYKEQQSADTAAKVEDVIGKYFENATGKYKLKILSPAAVREMTRLMVKADSSVKSEIIDYCLKECLNFLGSVDKEQIPSKIAEFRTKDAENFNNLLKELDKKDGKKSGKGYQENVLMESTKTRGLERDNGQITTSSGKLSTRSTISTSYQERTQKRDSSRPGRATTKSRIVDLSDDDSTKSY